MGWDKVKLGEILLRRKDSIKVLPNEEYKLVTIKLYHKGVILRNKVKGFEIKSPMSQIKTGDFILSGIDARNGAFGIVPEELDGAIVTNDFWCLDPDEDRLNKDFLLFLTTTNFFDNICKQSSDGTTQRIRLQKDKFFNYTIFLPSVEEQEILTKHFKKLEFDSFELKRELSNQLSLVKQLRQAFLSEAMQGKLLQSDVEDQETGQQLLARIKEEKAHLIKDKKLKKEKELPPIKPEDIPFEIPKDWAWSRLGEISNKLHYGFNASGNPNITDYRLLRITDIQNNKVEWQNVPGCVCSNSEVESYLLSNNDILIARTGGTIGKTYLVKDIFVKSLFASYLIRVVPNSLTSPDYLKYFMESPSYWKQLNASAWGAGQPNVNGNSLMKLILPLPSLSIQNQIVVKLDQLMVTCDDLENSIKQSQIQNEQLLQQVLKEALETKEEVNI